MASFGNKKGSALIILGTTIAVLGALVVVLSGYGYQWGWWHFSFGFSIIPWGTGGAVIGGILAAVGLYRMKDKSSKYNISGGIGIILGVLALGNFGYWYSEVQKGYPPIHDISTDTLNPPEFVAIVPLRDDAPNPPEYIRGETPAAQAAFYPDIETVTVNLDYDEAYNRALQTARDMSWEIVEENREDGRIEAYEKLAWFGFIDDVVIRVDTAENGTNIDIRSKSRIGRGDLGVNAKRIRAYVDEFED